MGAVDIGRYGLVRRSAVRARRNRRIRIAAAIIALAVVWLGFSVARQIAAERSSAPAGLTAQAPADTSAPYIGRGFTPSGSTSDADLTVPPSSTPAAASAVEPVDTTAPAGPQVSSQTPAPAAIVDEASGSRSQAPSLHASLPNLSGIPGVQNRREGTFDGTSFSPRIGGGGGASAGAPTTGDEKQASGTDVAAPLGRRASNDAEGPAPKAGSPGTGGPGGGSSPGGRTPGGKGSKDVDAPSTPGSGGSDSTPGSHGDDGGTTPGGSTPGGSTPGGSTPGGSTPGGSTPGGSTPGAGAPGSGTPDGPFEGGRDPRVSIDDDRDDVPTVPEPGSILLAVGAAAALARRHMAKRQ